MYLAYGRRIENSFQTREDMKGKLSALFWWIPLKKGEYTLDQFLITWMLLTN